MEKTVWKMVIGTGALCAAVGFSAAGRADDIVVGTGERHMFAVDADTVQTSPVRLSSRATLEKTGAGRLEIPDGAFTENAPIEIDVREGTVAFTPSDAPVAYAQPKDVMDRAVFWVAAETNLRPRAGGADGEVESWLDVRETGTGEADAPFRYPRAVAFTNDWLTAFPLAQAYGGKSGVYFRGYGNGCFMNWVKPDGTQANLTGLRHVFIVHGGETSSGHILGQRKGASPYFQRTGTIWVDMNSENGPIYSSRTYLNGAEIDAGVQSYPKKSVHVVEVEALGSSLGAMCFFNDRDFQLTGTAGTNIYNATGVQVNAILGNNEQMIGGDRAGGEYVFEMLLFTNNLTTVERLAVSDWLNQKWRGTPPPAVRPATTVRLATNTVVETTGAAPLTLVGDGCLRKIGADAMTIRSTYAPYATSRRVDVREGTLALGYGLPLVCAAGDTITCEQRFWGAEIAAPVAGSDDLTRLVKTGTGAVTLDTVPDGVSRISVQAGGLRLAAPERASRMVASPEDTVSATIPESDFESYPATSPTANFLYVGNEREKYGWHAIVPAKRENEADSAVFFFDQRLGSSKDWGLVLQADKSGVLVVKNRGSAWCEVEVPADGDYVLTFRASPRMGGSYAGKHLDVMIGSDAGSLVALGDFSVAGTSGWLPYSLGPIRLTAGVKQLWLKSNGDGSDKCTQFDDFRLARVAERPTWAIPNGGFENRAANFVNTSTVTADNTNRVPGFVVGQYTVPVSKSGSRMLSTFTVPGADGGRRFNAPWNRTGSRTQFFMVGSGASLSTTFTPPAGTWRFRADFSFLRTDNDAPESYTIAASVRIGETDVALGSVNTKSRALLPRDWPTAFSVDGTTPVTLTLTGGAAGASEKLGQALVDNLVLAAVDHVNLLKEGGFESMAPWHVEQTPKPMGNGGRITGSQQASYSDSSATGFTHFGTDVFEGNGYFKLVNDDTVWQSIDVPAPGLYRFSANLASRREGNDGNNSLNCGRNPIAFFVAQGGVTNWLGRTDDVAVTNFNEYAFMAYVPAAGVYDVGLKGQTVWDGVNLVDRTTLVDGVQFYRVETERPLELSSDLEIEVARGARLSLDFVGTNKIRRLVIGGRRRSGLVSAESRPDLFGLLSGPGALYIPPSGSALILR